MAISKGVGTRVLAIPAISNGDIETSGNQGFGDIGDIAMRYRMEWEVN